MPIISQEKQDALTQARLKSLLRYEPKTGKFFWKIQRRGVKKHSEAGRICHGYRWITIDGLQFMASRLAVLYMTGKWPKEYVDHINRDRGDNRWDNLRECTPAENSCNRSTLSRNTSGVVGVDFYKRAKKWRAVIASQRQAYHLGYFDTIEEATEAHAKAAQKYHGEFAADHSQAAG